MTARLEAAPNKGFFRRFAYWFSKRRYKKVLPPHLAVQLRKSFLNFAFVVGIVICTSG